MSFVCNFGCILNTHQCVLEFGSWLEAVKFGHPLASQPLFGCQPAFGSWLSSAKTLCFNFLYENIWKQEKMPENGKKVLQPGFWCAITQKPIKIHIPELVLNWNLKGLLWKMLTAFAWNISQTWSFAKLGLFVQWQGTFPFLAHNCSWKLINAYPVTQVFSVFR